MHIAAFMCEPTSADELSCIRSCATIVQYTIEKYIVRNITIEQNYSYVYDG